MNKNEIVSIIKRNGWLTYDKPLTTDSKHSRMTVEDAEWEESKHKRAKNGQFASVSGGGGASSSPDKKKGAEKRSRSSEGKASSEGVKPKKELKINIPGARELYDRIKRGDYLEPEELIKHPVVQAMDRMSDEFKEKYGYTCDINTPERQKLREEWRKQFLSTGSAVKHGDGSYSFDGKVKNGHKAVIAIGLPAAGKSTMIANPQSEKLGAFVFDSDEVKKLIPEFQESNGGAAASVHKESKDILKKAFDEFLTGKRNGDNLVVPVIGDDADDLFRKWIDPLEKAGYDVEVQYQDADPKASVNRVVARGIESGRIIPTDVVFKYGDKPRGVYEIYKKKKNGKGKPYVRS